MKKQFLDFNLSHRINKLGFDEECFAWWVSEEYGLELGLVKSCTLLREAVIAPLIQQTKTFLREKYGKFPVVYSDGFQWTYDLRWPDPTAILKDPYPGVMFPKYGEEDKREYFDTYQQAELRAIEKIIEIEENKTEN